MPYAAPWKATLTSAARKASIAGGTGKCKPETKTPAARIPRRGGFNRRSFLLVEFLPLVLHVRDRLELDVGELPAHLADLADVLVLDDVPRLRIDRDRSARAVRVLVAPPDLHRLFGVDLAALLPDRGVDRVHRVPGADRHEARRRLLAVFLLPRGDEGLVRRPVRGRGVVVHRDDPERRVAHVGKLFRSEERRVGRG